MITFLVYLAGGLGSWAATAALLKRSRVHDAETVRYLLANIPADWNSNDLYFKKYVESSLSYRRLRAAAAR